LIQRQRTVSPTVYSKRARHQIDLQHAAAQRACSLAVVVGNGERFERSARRRCRRNLPIGNGARRGATYEREDEPLESDAPHDQAADSLAALGCVLA
jgi:hypothetical protein